MRNIFIILTVFLLSSEGYTKERPELDSAMQKLFNSLINLQVMAISSERFKGKENQEIIKNELETMTKIKHSFTQKPKSEEPGMMAVLALFNDYVKDTKESLSHGNSEYARHRVRTLGSFCLGCHTRTKTGADFEDLGSRVSQLTISDFEKAELYAATRQFDKAIGAYRLYLQTIPKGEMDFINYTRALRNYIRLMVRVKQDAGMTLQTLDDLSKRKNLPEFDRRMISNWHKDAAFWAKEKFVMSEHKSEALFKKAEALIKRASTLHSFPSDENGDISYLRASSYLHEILDRDAKSELRGRALYLLGIAYGSLQETFLWDLDTMFFEQCIREFSHTVISEKCYSKYADRLYFGYTGSGGTFLPEEVLKKAEELRMLGKLKQ